MCLNVQWRVAENVKPMHSQKAKFGGKIQAWAYMRQWPSKRLTGGRRANFTVEFNGEAGQAVFTVGGVHYEAISTLKNTKSM